MQANISPPPPPNIDGLLIRKVVWNEYSPYNVIFKIPDRKLFLATWKDIPASGEVQFTISNVQLTTDQAESKLNENFIFTIARRTVDSQDLMYMSIKLVNNIWVLAEFKILPGSSSIVVSD